MHECGEIDTANGVTDHMIDAKNSILKGNHYVDISYPPASGRGAGAIRVCGVTRWGEPGGVGQCRHRTYAVSAGPLHQVLNQFAQQSGVLLSYDPALTQGKTSQGLRGSFSVEQGFQSILTHSGLQAQVGADGTVTLAKQAPETPAAAPASHAAKTSRWW